MAVVIIDVLEVVDVDERQRQLRFAATLLDQIPDAVFQQAAIGQAGQIVEIGAPEQLVLQPDLIRDIGRRRDVVARAVNDDRVTNDFECAIGGSIAGDFAAARIGVAIGLRLSVVRLNERARAGRAGGARQSVRAMPYRGGVGVERRAVGGLDAEAQRQLANDPLEQSRGLDRLPPPRYRAVFRVDHVPALRPDRTTHPLAPFCEGACAARALAPIMRPPPARRSSRRARRHDLIA